MQEIYKDIPWYEWYQVSNLGNVRSLIENERILKSSIKKSWYLYVNIKKKHHYIHRIVAQSFITNPENKRTVNHKDGNKLNNSIDNLEWATYSENMKHAFASWLKFNTENNNFIKNHPKNNLGKLWKDNHNSKKVSQVDVYWNFIRIWESIADVKRILWIDDWSVVKCCKWRQKTAGGFVWRYL